MSFPSIDFGCVGTDSLTLPPPFVDGVCLLCGYELSAFCLDSGLFLCLSFHAPDPFFYLIHLLMVQTDRSSKLDARGVLDPTNLTRRHQELRSGCRAFEDTGTLTSWKVDSPRSRFDESIASESTTKLIADALGCSRRAPSGQ